MKKSLLFILCLCSLALSVAIPFSPSAYASTSNLAEDNFARANTTAGWVKSTNNDGLTNYPWNATMKNSPDAFIQNGQGVLIYPGTNGHKDAGYLGFPAHTGGDVLAEITFSAVGHAMSGVTVQTTSSSYWYQADLYTPGQTLDMWRRSGYASTKMVSVPLPTPIVAGQAEWIRLDASVQQDGSELVQARAWPAGTTEPTTWLASFVDSAPILPGSAGALADWLKTPTGSEPIMFSSWSYAASGLAAPAN